MKKLILIFASLIISQLGMAKTIKTSFVSMDLPDNWTCQQNTLQWSCSLNNNRTTKEAIIILSAKAASSKDTTSSLKKILGQPKTLPSKKGTPTFSKVISSGQQLIQGQQWVRSTHENSELENYQSTYLATRVEKLIIVISFNVHKKYESQFNNTFNQAIDSIEIIASDSLLNPDNQVPVVSPGPQATMPLGAEGGDEMTDSGMSSQSLLQQIRHGPLKWVILLGLFLFLGLIWYSRK